MELSVRKEILDFFASLIYRELGIVYDESVYYQLESRLNDLLSRINMGTIEDFYQESLKGLPPKELGLLLDIATNNETSFFRDTAVFQSLKLYFSQYFSKNCFSPCRIWSAATSTGQEIYSMAILLNEIGQQFPHARFEILASDISDRVLTYAMKGEYTALEVRRGLSSELLNKYFREIPTPRGSAWEVVPALKKHISFFKQNLLGPWQMSGTFDLIMCRNVLIYQDMGNKRKILDKMGEYLRPEGCLVLGGGENLLGVSEAYCPVMIGASTFYQKCDSGS